MTTFGDQVYQYGGMPVGVSGLPFPATGKAFFVDPVNGSDGNSGKKPSEALATLYKAHSLCTSGNNDVVYLIGDGGTTATARLSTALAASVDSSVTAGTLIWSKSATHLIGITAPTMNRRARIATPTGTYTYTTFGSVTNLITVSGSGNYFANFSVFSQFSTGGAGEILMEVTGQRNSFNGVDLLGPGSTAAIQGTGSRTVKITGGGENTFVNCTLGLDTVTKTVANATLEFASATARNRFDRCVFPMYGSGNGQFWVIGTGAGCMDRWQLFTNCWFLNNVESGSANLTAATSLTNAAAGGMLVMANCNLVGATKWGDTNALAQMYVSNVGGAATDGLMLAPT